jgi:hypothetical protein
MAVTTSCHYYPLASSAFNSGCRVAQNNVLKNLGKPSYKILNFVTFLEATGRLSPGSASTQKTNSKEMRRD